ncbi:aldehyde dehydrogenase family protein [Acinetobacter haemolyticus]|uniref:Aldehyde dehydrogenase family protein n=1 Tax=Acinetobacter haemolyticus TaxID=29430 RepID=A0AAJ3D9L2_ACIHA|nr:aldehyde dehydrogenase [Acinetobacter haemolyticus]NAR18393.1 aldehyde dehydrogenase family protein [Acinetobacter haemolyticus]NAR36464.1 aldehyde dehydrogenase family protein [Acinetobacter haemolyticus]NAR46845.1 aldehyde dehydrogenase family protein [Acinetobacter haemolyticus]NAR65237.1 aldehyde dehydrogenase family protein [Acinetobacter haemolyticus]NAR73824.1 aldehyde dehydrogenase family protein [Acinetobacter haemolyticus]
MVKEIYIAGEWRLGRGDKIQSLFPADQSVNAEISTASLDDVNEAIEKADLAWRQTEWRNSMPHERARILYKVADIIEARVDELSQLQTRDNGKPLAETRALVMSAAATARYVAAACETLNDELTTQRAPDFMTMSVHEPVGVVAAITPWNSPIASEVQKLAPALAGGNAVILKPAEVTSLIALELAKIFEEAGLPKGLLSVLVGRGSVIGDAIVKHPLVRKISFTGGTSTGRHLAHIAADKLITTSLELGGKSPTIVMQDADIELAAKGVAYGIFSSAGQACIAGSRLFVHHSIYDQFLTRLVEITKGLRVGHPETADVHLGSLINPKHLASVEAYVQLAKKEGGQVLVGGQALTDGELAKGSFYLPTIITGLDNSAKTCQEEIFGPVLVVMKYDDEADLIAQANDSCFGLAAGIWTENYRKAWQLARALEVGTVWINTYKKFSISAPFGGFKESGIGREKGRLGILAYMQQKSIYMGLSEQPNPWCD